MTEVAPRPVVAAFDLDGTLTHGGSVVRFLVAVRGRRRVLGALVRLSPRLGRAALVGGRAADDVKEALFVRTLGGRAARPVEELAVAFGAAHYRRRARPDVRRRLEWHRRQGHALVVVSASPSWYVEAIARHLQLDGAVATHLEITDDGRLTGHYDGGNCRGARKVELLQRWMASARPGRVVGEGSNARSADAPSSGEPRVAKPGDQPFLWAYGNSAGDLELLAGADVGVDVGRLGRLGRLRRFRRLRSLRAEDTADAPTRSSTVPGA